MPLSSNSLIHLTKNRTALEGILLDDFQMKYCKETIYFREHSSTIHVPMVSFCDIPLSQIKDHISSYGCYGIGLTREWAIRNHLNPVIYIQKNSSLAHSFEQAISHYENIDPDSPDAINALKRLIDIFRYTKNYEGTLSRSGQPPKKYRFSDEREWRFVPDIDQASEMYYSDTDFTIDNTKEIANKSISNVRLAFEPNDIKYIIINDESEITHFINHLRTAKGAKYSMQDMEKLTSRILTSEQIRTDF